MRTRAKDLRALVAFGLEGGKELGAMRCGRDADVALAILHLDEHWVGRDSPTGLEGEAVSPMGRILCLAQTVEVFWQEGGRDVALAVARERRGRWFDPARSDLAAIRSACAPASSTFPPAGCRSPTSPRR